MSRCPLFNQTPTETLTWVYPQNNAVIYEASTFVLGSTSKAIDALSLNGSDVPLHPHEDEKAFAHVVALQEGENILELVANTGERLTRKVIRQIPWRFSEEAKSPLFAVSPQITPAPRYLLGQSFPVEVRAMTHIQQVWLNLTNEAGELISEIPLRCDDAFLLNPKSPTHGKQVSVFGELHYNETHPPIDKSIKVFHGVVDLTHPLLYHLPDSHVLHLHYKVLDDKKQVGMVNLGQSVSLWQFQRTVEVTASCQAFYAGNSEKARRLTLLPPLHSPMPVVGLLDVDEFLIQADAHSPYLLKGGKPHVQAGKGMPVVLDALSLEDNHEGITTTFHLTHPCGTILLPDSDGLTLSMTTIEAGLNHQRYQSSDLRWQIKTQGDGLSLSLPLAWQGFKGVESHWSEKGLEVSLLKLPVDKKAWRILLDAGHGGQEDGTRALNGTLEKTWSLELAKRIKLLLHEAGVEQVFLTRDDDVTLSLRERQQLADDVNADLSLSLHANALPDGEDPTVREGVSVHSYTPWSQPIGDALLESLATVQAKDGRYCSNYAMTRLPRCVSILVEYGYFIHPQDYARLLDEDHLWRLAHATVAGILNA
jgi:N-acetylmuramoyl-L-alanine amidase